MGELLLLLLLLSNRRGLSSPPPPPLPFLRGMEIGRLEQVDLLTLLDAPLDMDSVRVRILDETEFDDGGEFDDDDDDDVTVTPISPPDVLRGSDSDGPMTRKSA